MSSIDFTSPLAPTVDLGLTNWSDQAKDHANLLSWWTLRTGRWSEAAGRITGCAPRAGAVSLIRAPTSLGPVAATVDGLSCADFTTGELNGLQCPQTVYRDHVGVVAIAWLGPTAPIQNRDLLGVYGTGDTLRIWRSPASQWSWRVGSTDAAAVTRAWAPGPLLVLGERVGATFRLRLRDRAGTTAIVSGDLAPGSVSAAPTVVFGQDEIADGHANAAPAASRSWSEYLCEAAVYRGAVLSDAAVLAFWDAYFAAVYQGA